MRRHIIRTFIVALLLLPLAPMSSAGASSGTTYHVSCRGWDTSTGKDSRWPWLTLERASNAALQPGDTLALERGCVWDGERLDAGWHGTPQNPITITAYGSGANPVIRNGTYQNLKFTGSYVVAEHLDLDYTNVEQRECGQYYGTVYGANFTSGAHHNTIRYSRIRHATAGVHLGIESHSNRVIKNDLIDNWVRQPKVINPGDILGAWGVVVASDDNEIAHNLFRGNKSSCVEEGIRRIGTSVEVWRGDNNSIHHNWVWGERVFAELGGSATDKAINNRFHYNMMVSDEEDARFVIAHGDEVSFGPTLGTVVDHNSVFLQGAGSDAVVCGSGCDTSVLTLTNNVLDAKRKPLFTDEPIIERANVYWSTGVSSPSGVLVQSPTALRDSFKADPMFVNRWSSNLRPGPGSPAINNGVGGASQDILGKPSPLTGAHDIGAYEVG